MLTCVSDWPDIPAFSRTGETLPDGPCGTELKTVVPEEMHDDFVALASMHRKTKSEYLRLLVTEHLYGKLESARQKVAGVAVSGEGRQRGA